MRSGPFGVQVGETQRGWMQHAQQLACCERDGRVGILLPGCLVPQGGCREGRAAGAGLALLAGTVCPHGDCHGLGPPDKSIIVPWQADKRSHAQSTWQALAECLNENAHTRVLKQECSCVALYFTIL